MKKIRYSAALAILALCVAAFASSSYPGKFPNCSKITCGTCHSGSSGFYNDFAANNHTWDATLAHLDSDGDGFTNGEDLQDTAGTHPDCAASGDTSKITKPNDVSSYPVTSSVIGENRTITGGLSLSISSVPGIGNKCFSFTMRQNGWAELSIMNIQGQSVARICSADYGEGPHSVIWDASHNPDGFYFAVLKAAGRTYTQKILLIK